MIYKPVINYIVKCSFMLAGLFTPVALTAMIENGEIDIPTWFQLFYWILGWGTFFGLLVHWVATEEND